jgi:hypothetical protein
VTNALAFDGSSGIFCAGAFDSLLIKFIFSKRISKAVRFSLF